MDLETEIYPVQDPGYFWGGFSLQIGYVNWTPVIGIDPEEQHREYDQEDCNAQSDKCIQLEGFTFYKFFQSHAVK